MFKKSLMVFLVFVILAGVIGCTSATPTTKPADTPVAAPVEPTKAPLPKIALLIRGVVNDAGWGAAAYDGLMGAKEKYGVEVAYSENVNPNDDVATMRDYANNGYDVIIGHGDDFTNAALTVAKEFPNKIFAVTNAPVKAENVQGLDTKNQEAGYMAGIIAGLLSKTKKVGYISVMEILSMKRGEIGFRDGVKEVCPECEVFVTYTGNFTDIGLGKEAALALIDRGVDISFQYADAPGLGAIQAAKEKGLMIIGSGQDQSSLAPDQVVTTVIQDLAPLIVNLVGEVIDGTFKPNTIAEHGFDTGIYYLAPLNDKLVTAEQKATIQSYVDKLKDHTLVLPAINELPTATP